MKDVTAPSLVKAEIADYKTVVLTFDEDIADLDGSEIVKTELGTSEITDDVTVTKEGTNAIKLTYENELVAGEYTFTVSGIKDVADTPNELTAAAPATITQTKEESVISKAVFKTTSLPAAYNKGADDQSAYDSTLPLKFTNAAIELEFYDQFSKEIDIDSASSDLTKDMKVTATVGNMPLQIGKTEESDADITSGDKRGNETVKNGTVASKVYIADANATALIEGAEVNVKILNGTTVIGQTDPAYTLQPYTEAQPTEIRDIKLKDVTTSTTGTDVEGTALTNGHLYELSVTWNDQYGNEIADKNNTKVTWTVNDSEKAAFVEVTGDPYEIEDEVTSPLLEKAFLNAKTSGAVTVTVYATGKVSKDITFTISAPELEGISGGAISVGNYNDEEIETAVISGTAGAVLTADMLNAKVTGKDTDGNEIAAADLPTVTFDYKKDSSGELVLAGGQKQIVAKIKTKVPGDYSITYYVGVSADDKDAKTASTTFTTTKNPTVDKIELAEFVKDELTTNGTVTKALTLTNKHGENINDVITTTNFADSIKVYDDVKEAEKGSATVSERLAATSVDEDADGKPTGGITGIEFTAANPLASVGGDDELIAGTYYVRIQSGTATLIRAVNVSEEGKIKDINLSATTVDAIVDDALDTGTTGKKADDIKVEAGVAYKLIKIGAKNQYGKDMKVSLGSPTDGTQLSLDGKTVTVANSTTSTAVTKVVYFDAAKESVGTDDTKAIQYIGVALTTTGATDTNPKNTVTLSYAASESADKTEGTKTITVTPKDARKLETLSIKADNTTILKGNDVTCILSAVDQYNGVYTLNASQSLVSSDATVDVSTRTFVANSDGDDTNLEFKLTPSAAGSHVVKLTYTDATAGEKDVTVNLDVKEVADISTVKFDGTLDGGEIKLPETKQVYYDASDSHTYILDAEALSGTTTVSGAAENLFNIDASDADLQVKNKDGEDKNEPTGLALRDDGHGNLQLELGTTDADWAEGDQVFIKLYDKSTKVSASLKLVISKVVPEIKTDVTVVNAQSTPDSTTKAFDSVIAGVNATADGKGAPVQLGVQGVTQYGKYETLKGNNVIYTVANESIATVDADGYIHAVKVGSTTINVKAPKQETISVPVTVTADDLASTNKLTGTATATKDTKEITLTITGATMLDTVSAANVVVKDINGKTVAIDFASNSGSTITITTKGSIVPGKYTVYFTGLKEMTSGKVSMAYADGSAALSVSE